jgi:hypothetical protein
MRAREANQSPEAEPDESKQGQDLYQNAGETTAAMLLISKSAGVLANDTSRPHHPTCKNCADLVRGLQRATFRVATRPAESKILAGVATDSYAIL